MKTYWLLSEDDENIRRRFGSKDNERQQNCMCTCGLWMLYWCVRSSNENLKYFQRKMLHLTWSVVISTLIQRQTNKPSLTILTSDINTYDSEQDRPTLVCWMKICPRMRGWILYYLPIKDKTFSDHVQYAHKIYHCFRGNRQNLDQRQSTTICCNH